MDFTGKVIFIGQPRSGTSSSGKPWTSQEFVIEDASARFPAKLCFSVFGGDRLQRFAIQMGETITVSFDIDAHEYNGRWFNNVNAYAVTRPAQAQPSPVAAAPAFGPAPEPSDALPF